MTWLPAASDAVLMLTVPLLSDSTPPRSTPLSRNWTWPVGVPLPGALATTVTVKLTSSPHAAGVAEGVRIVVVLSACTVCVIWALLARKGVAAPPYSAVIGWPPTARLDVVKVAWPCPFSVPVPSVVEPSRNVTMPVGTPAPEVTVAVSVIDCPDTEVLDVDCKAVVVPPIMVTVDVAVAEE